MRTSTAIICEYNPMHPGHLHLLKLAKTESSPVIAVMSGNFTQRGTPAVYDKYVRAEAAVRCGADLVVELPYPWCASGAEDFARGGVTVAEGLGADSLTFGSESGDFSLLKKAAAIRGSAEFTEKIRTVGRESRTGGSAAIYEAVMRELGVDGELGANDKLGLEYVRFGMQAGLNNFRPVKRMQDVPSASEIRETLFREGFDAAEPMMAEEALRLYRNALLCEEARFEELLFAHSRLYIRDDEENDLLRYAAKAARESVSPEEFMKKLPTKKYTAARMRRELLHALIGSGCGEKRISELAKNPPRFTVLLAANAVGRTYLAEKRRTESLPVIIKPADTAALDEEGRKQYALQRRADEVYAFLTGLPGDEFMKRHPGMM